MFLSLRLEERPTRGTPLSGTRAAALVTQPVHGGGGGGGRRRHVIASALLIRCSFPLHALIATDFVPIQFILEMGETVSCGTRQSNITEPSP